MMTIYAAKIDVRKCPVDPYRPAANKRTRVYLFPEESILDNMRNRNARPYKEYREKILPDVLLQVGVPGDTKVTWSQTAGCACGCSPGFIIHGHMNHEVFVDIKDDPEPTAEEKYWDERDYYAERNRTAHL